jgi:hypothetical protein
LSSLRRDHNSGKRPAGARGAPFASPFFLAVGEQAYGFIAAAELACADLAPEGARPAPPKPLPSDAPDAITSELALSEIADPASLLRPRRRFMWANHPDRRPDLPRELANRRVAIANMLIDRTLMGGSATAFIDGCASDSFARQPIGFSLIRRW